MMCDCMFLKFIHRLQVISTKVGGVPEVLPENMIRLVEPNVQGKCLLKAVLLQILTRFASPTFKSSISSRESDIHRQNIDFTGLKSNI